MNWHLTLDLNGPGRRGPIVPVGLPVLEVARIEFKDKFTIYRSSDDAADVKPAKKHLGHKLQVKTLNSLAKGAALKVPEWDIDRKSEQTNLPVALFLKSTV